MSRGAWVLLVGLFAATLVAPGALGCGSWNRQRPGDQANAGTQFTAQSTSAGAPPIALIAIIALPLVLLGIVGAAVRAMASKPTIGRWVVAGNRWVWVPDRK